MSGRVKTKQTRVPLYTQTNPFKVTEKKVYFFNCLNRKGAEQKHNQKLIVY